METDSNLPSKELQEIATKLQGTLNPQLVTKKKLLEHFGFQGRCGSLVRKHIKKHLRRLNIVTVPDLNSREAKEFRLMRKSKVDPSTRIPSQQEYETGTIGELELAETQPIFIKLDETLSDGAYTQLLNSEKRGLVLVVEEAKSILGSNGVPEKWLLRNPRGAISWKSYAKALTKKGKAPSIIEAMDTDIMIVRLHEDLTEKYQHRSGILVVMDDDNYVCGLLTYRDIAQSLFKDQLLPYFLVGVIEDMLRNRIKQARFQPEEIQNVINERALTKVLVPAMEEILKEAGIQKTSKEIKTAVVKHTRCEFKGEDYMDFDNYQSVFQNDELFRKMNIRGSAQIIRDIIDGVRDARNELMHFNLDDEKDYVEIFSTALNRLRSLMND